MAAQKKTPPKGGRSRTNSRPSNRKKSFSKRTPKGTPGQLRKASQRRNADAARSGLTPHDCNKACFEHLTAQQTFGLTGFLATSYVIPYPDICGDLTDYYRVRYTEEVKGAFGAARKKPLRYSGPRDALPRFYFPIGVDWLALAKNPSEPIIITEGEKKAVKACKSGLPCISVPGVWAWRSKKKGIAAIPDFDLIEWAGRKVYLAFDSDLMTKPQVNAALDALANELTMRGAKVVIKFLQ